MNCRPVRVQAQNPPLLMLCLLFTSVLSVATGAAAQDAQPASRPSPRQTRLGLVYAHTDLPADEAPRYFPDGTFNDKPGAYDFMERFCPWFLRSMKEPPLL